jgi:spermidine synthase
MTFGWACDSPELRRVPLDVLRRRFEASGIGTRYYNPEIHLGSFALPQYVMELIRK